MSSLNQKKAQKDPPYLSISIDLLGNSTYRSRSRAYARWERLKYMLRDIISMARTNLDHELIHQLETFVKTPRFLILNAPHWTLDLTQQEWDALSRGLRTLGTPSARSMYLWLNNVKVHNHGD